ncbi:hypothetical protein LOD99_2722 [Oopsacas minuta]|uniref:Tudor domain-containing protein n=1 Tax=Oopsacas minuta TaxID=111878 RepID=A0AAV7K0X3_9METZ|nr:hypothetical protein LOD99_2722 [Oopsacas minuta]
MATQSPPSSLNVKERETSRQEDLKSELSQSLSELSSVSNSTQGKKKGKRRKHNPLLHTHNISKNEEEVARSLSRESFASEKQHTKPIPQSMKGTQVCARSSRDGLFYPGIVLKHVTSNNVIVQFADGQTDRISTRLVVPRGGARPCPVLHPGDYVLVRVRSKYGQHPNLSTGMCDYFIPAIVQVTPYKGGITFPPSSVPVYAATSFNGRPVSSLRAGMIRISRAYFLSVCRYIQQLMVGLSSSIEQEERRHPALYDSVEDEGEFKLQKSPSMDTLSKLVEKQSEQHIELMERLSLVISLSSRDPIGETGPQSVLPDSEVPDAQAESITFELTPTCDMNVDTLSLERMRPFSAPAHTQTSASIPDTIPYLVDQGVQVTGMHDKWTESLPSTYTQGTSTQLDDCLLEPTPDPRMEDMENSQKKLLEELEGVTREVTALKARNSEVQESPNAYLVMQADGQTMLVPHKEGAESPHELSRSDQGPTLLIQDLTPQVSPPPVVTFSSGESVLVDSRRDGWFYAAEVLSEDIDRDSGVTLRMKINGETVWEETDKLLPFSSSESRLPEVYSDQRVLAEHPSFPTCYVPGQILRIDGETGEAEIKFYDDVTCNISWSRIQPVDEAVCSALSEIASQYDSSWITESVVCRREQSGVFYSAQVVGKSWKTRHYMIQFPDGAIEEQSIVHIFRAPGDEESGVVDGSYVLASPDAGLFMPGEVRECNEGMAVVKFCHGEEKEIKAKELIVISKLYYQDMFLFISSQLQEVED